MMKICIRIYSPTSKLLNGNKIMVKKPLVPCRHAKEAKNWPAGKATKVHSLKMQLFHLYIHSTYHDPPI